jgi:NADH-quinone oxidoreductase subunit I
MGVLKDFLELVRGMRITGKHLGRHAVTIQYPEEKWEMPERSRGVVVLLSDKETGELNCTMCMLCMRACPTAAIRIDAPRGEDKKRHLNSFEVDHALCCYCGLCEDACNFSALKMATKYEFSTCDKDELVWDVNKLQEVGRDVPYVDTRKKKKKDAKAAPKPAEKKAEKPALDKPAEDKPADTKPAEDKPTEDKPARDKPSENAPVESAATANPAPSEDSASPGSEDTTKEADTSQNEKQGDS